MPDPVDAKFTVNGKEVAIKSDPERSVLEILREDLHLTGTKYGCGEGACGACTILIDGKPKFSCSILLNEIAGRKITTIEGLAKGETLHPAQQAFLELEGFQCGFCTAGMIVATAGLLENGKINDEVISKALDTHICRCCTYPKIAAAVKRAAEIVMERNS